MDKRNLISVLMMLLFCSMDSVWSQDQTTNEVMKTTTSTTATTETTATTDTTATTETTATTATTETTATTATTDTTATTNADGDTTTLKDTFTDCIIYKGTPLDLEPLKGYWYETARNTEVDTNMQCLNISVPARVNGDNKIDLSVEYVDTKDGKWQSAQKSGSFPWDENTQNGIFTWNTGEETSLPITYKLINTDGTSYAFLCGYSASAPVPHFKVWTRKRHLSPEEKTAIQLKFAEVGEGSDIVWVEQSLDKCNSAMRSAGSSLVALAFTLLIYGRQI